MSRRLILLRHSKAESYGSVQDYLRELTPAGRKKATTAAKMLVKKTRTPQLILSSGAKRALQTAQIIAKGLEYPEQSILVDDDIYYGSAQSILDLVRKVPDDIETVLLVGHNPSISETAYSLVSHETAGIDEIFGLRAGLSTANAAVLKSNLPFSQWEWSIAEKCKLILVDA